MDLNTGEKENQIVTVGLKVERLEQVVQDASKMLGDANKVKLDTEIIVACVKEVKDLLSNFKKIKDTSDSAIID